MIHAGVRQAAIVGLIVLRVLAAVAAGGALTGLLVTFSAMLLAPVGAASPEPFRLAGMLLYAAYLLLLLRGYRLRRLLLVWLTGVLAAGALLVLLDVRTDRVNYPAAMIVRT
jgi:hypothetical protein